MDRPHRYLSVEEPDNKAVVDFQGKYGFTVTISTETDPRSKLHRVYVIVKADDDRSTILGEIHEVIPKADDRR